MFRGSLGAAATGARPTASGLAAAAFGTEKTLDPSDRQLAPGTPPKARRGAPAAETRRRGDSRRRGTLSRAVTVTVKLLAEMPLTVNLN